MFLAGDRNSQLPSQRVELESVERAALALDRERLGERAAVEARAEGHAQAAVAQLHVEDIGREPRVAGSLRLKAGRVERAAGGDDRRLGAWDGSGGVGHGLLLRLAFAYPAPSS